LEKSYRDMRNRVKGAYYELSGMLSERMSLIGYWLRGYGQNSDF